MKFKTVGSVLFNVRTEHKGVVDNVKLEQRLAVVAWRCSGDWEQSYDGGQ